MFDLLRRLLATPDTAPDPSAPPIPPGTPPAQAPLRLAACALLVELARADGEFSDAERAHIAHLMTETFGVTASEADALMTAADHQLREAVDLHAFVSVVNARYDDVERGVLAEMLWRVADADGTLSHHESYLIRRLGTLLDLPPGALQAARTRAAERRAG